MLAAVFFLSFLCGVGLGSSVVEVLEGSGFGIVKVILFTVGIAVCALINLGVIT